MEIAGPSTRHGKSFQLWMSSIFFLIIKSCHLIVGNGLVHQG